MGRKIRMYYKLYHDLVLMTARHPVLYDMIVSRGEFVILTPHCLRYCRVGVLTSGTAWP